MPPPQVKRNTVDLISSKTSYETVIPVHVLPNHEEYESFLQRCKPFDIIDGRNPFDEPNPAPAGTSARPDQEEDEVAPSSAQPSTGPGRRRHRSNSPTAFAPTKRGAVRRDVAADEDPFHVQPSPLLSSASSRAAPRKGWAESALAVTTPYALATPQHDHTRVGYVLDSADYAWCRKEGVRPASLQHGFTFLEWRYVQHILQRATSAAEMARGSAERQSQQRRAARANGGSGGGADSSRCAVCARPVEFLQAFDEDSVSVLPGVNSAVGIRCQACGTPAHLQCWYLTEMPRAGGSWECDACSSATRGGRRRQHQRCVICGRTGGVMLAYHGHHSAAANGGGAPRSPASPSSVVAGSPVSTFSPTTPTSPHGSGHEPLCHVVCALAFAELAIEAPPTQVRRNGLVDMAYRPFVYAVRRIAKQRYPMNCGYCSQEGGIAMTCHHPRCFESMHAACAAEARAVECVETVEAGDQENTSSAFLSAPSSPVTAQNTRPAPTAAEVQGSGQPQQQQPWSQCHVYCLKHFGVTPSYSLGSSALGQEAESSALAADLTGVLTTQLDHFATGSSDYPESQKRGRGRPPVALVKQREQEVGLIAKVKAYWLQQRQERRRESGQLVLAINTLKTTSILAAAFRPELIKIAPTKVRLSHFICLVPEWQQYLVMNVEGELPLPDEEYEDAQRYRKNHAPHTRRSGNTNELYEKLKLVRESAEMFCALSQQVQESCALRTQQVELVTHALDLTCQWDK